MRVVELVKSYVSWQNTTRKASVSVSVSGRWLAPCKFFMYILGFLSLSLLLRIGIDSEESELVRTFRKEFHCGSFFLRCAVFSEGNSVVMLGKTHTSAVLGNGDIIKCIADVSL